MVDYVIASEKCINDIVLFDVVPLNTFSDHCLLEFSLCVKYEITNVIEDYTKKVSGDATNYKWSREYSNAYLLEYECGDIQQKLNDFMGMSLDNGNVDHILQCFNNIIYTAADRTLPKIPRYRSKTKHLSLRKKRYKWFDDDCYQLKKKLKSTCEALARDRTNPYLRGLYCKQKKQYKRKVRDKKRSFKKSQIIELEQLQNDKLKNISGNLDENLDQEQKSIDPDNWYNYFSNLGNPLVNSEHFDQAFYDDVTNPSNQNKFMNNAGLDCLITEIEVDKAIKSLKSNKQPGHDGIRAEMIHARIYLHVCKPLTKLFKFIWDTEKVPVSWSDGLICPIHKKGPKNDPGNFRGVNLLSSVGKLFQIVFRNRLDHWAKDVLIDNQTGFKSGYSAIDNIFVLNMLLQKFQKSKEEIICLFC